MGELVQIDNASTHLWGDVDCSDEVDPIDSLRILRVDAGLPVSDLPGCPDVGDLVTVSEI
jgi:hypothetical protein